MPNTLAAAEPFNAAMLGTVYPGLDLFALAADRIALVGLDNEAVSWGRVSRIIHPEQLAFEPGGKEIHASR